MSNLIRVEHTGIEGTALVPETALKHMDGEWRRVGPEQPAGNASRDTWAEYALSVGATEESIADLTRDQLRDQYGQPTE